MEQRVAALERRVDRLAAATLAGAGETSADPTVGGATLQLLNRLRERAGTVGAQTPAPEDAPTGAIAYAGAASVDGREHLWAKEHDVADLVGADWTSGAGTLECLGSPARLLLLAAVIEAPRSRAQLQEALGETSTGHLYHHLRALQAAGLLVQRRRGEYELPAQRLVPLLAIIAAALDLGTGRDRQPLDDA
jgi:DNA-binding transcriptional ArsR family regulator